MRELGQLNINLLCQSVQAAIRIYHKLGAYKQQNFISHNFWSLEVQNQHASRVPEGW